MALLTIEESINGGAAARAKNAERKARAELVAFVETTYTLTVKDGVMEFTSPSSPIVPVVVIYGGISCGGVARMFAAAGPGQSVSANTLAACETVALGRLQANRAARLDEQAKRWKRWSEMAVYTMTPDAEYLHNLAVLDARYREMLAALDADHKAKLGVLHTAHHEERVALLADYRALLADYRALLADHRAKEEAK